MKQLTPIDASFVYLEDKNQYMHIAGLYIYDPSTVPPEKKRRHDVVGHKDILDNIAKTLHLAPNMRRKLAFLPGNIDHPWWVEDSNFDIEFHVRHIALPKPGDWQQLCILIARLISRPLDMTRPLWETYIIENLDNIPGLPPGCFATLNKVHHAAIDGASGIQQMMAMHALSPDGEPPDPHDDWKGEADPSTAELLTRSWINSLGAPLRAAEIVGRAASGLFRGARGVGAGQFGMPINAPKTIFNHMLSPHRVFDARVFDLNDIKAIKRAVEGATVNDAVLSICGGALREYLLSKKQLPKDSLTAMIPIDVRTESERATGGNIVSTMTSAIGTDIADPLKRLHAVREHTSKAKELTQALGQRELADLANLMPAAAASFAMRNSTAARLPEFLQSPVNLVISNVPGAQVPLYMGGSQLMASFGIGPNIHGSGLFIAPQSYNGILSISFNACRAMMPDPQHFAECIVHAKDELQKRVLNKVIVKTPSDLVKMTAKRMKENADAQTRTSKKTKTAKRKRLPKARRLLTDPQVLSQRPETNSPKQAPAPDRQEKGCIPSA